MSSSLSFIGQQITIYTGILMFIAGTIGGCLNIIVFLSLKTFRESSCAFYLTVLSFTNVVQLISGLLTRLMISGFNIDWTQSSIFYCKARPYILNAAALTSATCICLAIIDQYFATSTHRRWQQWCNVKLAQRLVIICSMIWLLEQIPSLVFYNHAILPTTNQTMCTITNMNFSLFNSYFTVITLWSVLPLLIFVVFGSLIYRNVHQIAYRANLLVRRELDKQLTIMVLVQAVFIFVAIVPNLVTNLLNLNAINLKNNLVATAQLNFATTITLVLYYLYFSSPFYIYICVSERFRRQLIYVIFNLYINRAQQRLANINHINQVAPL